MGHAGVGNAAVESGGSYRWEGWVIKILKY